MIKWFVGTVAMVGVFVGVLLSRPERLHAQAASSCETLRVPGTGRATRALVDLAYTVDGDVEVGIGSDATSVTASLKVTLPKLVDGKPNPDFERMFALLMKGFGGGITQICHQGAAGTSGVITKVTLGAEASGIQRVQPCYDVGGGRVNCARVSDLGYLFTTN